MNFTRIVSLLFISCLIVSIGYCQGIEDVWNRDLSGHNLMLVDWEGPIANPAMKYYLRGPATGSYPFTVTLSVSDNKIYFDDPCTISTSGSIKTVTIPNSSTKVAFYMAVYNDADALDDTRTLNASFKSNTNVTTNLSFTIHVIDQDLASSPAPLFPIVFDFSKDQTGFFNVSARNVIIRAANDWAYYLGNMNLLQVPAGDENTFIWDPTGFYSGAFTVNSNAYTGYLLYAYGIHDPTQLRSGGEPSDSDFQKSATVTYPIRRSGGTEIETAGNYNSIGWLISTNDADWWKSRNLGSEQNDLLSIAHHEIGHALFFNPAHTLFGSYKSQGFINDALVVAYHGGVVNIDSHDHFDGSVDNASQRGAFGYEYYGNMPARRWTMTKLDLLCAQAVGYLLKPTSPFTTATVDALVVPQANKNQPYSVQFHASGGIPFYRWRVTGGTLPPGLSLNSFDGTLSGTPTQAGSFNFTLNVQEYGDSSGGYSQSTTLVVSSGIALTGTVTLNGIALANEKGLLVRFKIMGANHSVPIQSSTVELGNNGAYFLPIDVPGTFAVGVSGVNWLQQIKLNQNLNSNITINFSGPAGSGLINGDTNSDGIVDDTDLLGVINTFLSTGPFPNSSGYTDVNHNGLVDDTDLLIVINNFLTVGDQ